MLEDIFINLGVSALLTVVKVQKDRRRFARVLAKVFVAIQNAARDDSVLAATIQDQVVKEGLK